MKNSSREAVLRDEGSPEKRNANLETPCPLCAQKDKDLRSMRAHRDELAECLNDAVDRMLGSSPGIAKLRDRSLAALAKVPV